MSNAPTSRTGQEGYVVVVVALLLIALIGFAALSVDAGLFYSTRTSAQRIVDASAVAGAFTFVINPLDAQPAGAEAAARALALDQDIRGIAIENSEVGVSVDTVNRRVTVTLDRAETSIFGRALGVLTADIGVTATAEASLSAGGATCVKPWIIPNTVLLPDGASVCAVCPGSPDYDPALEAQLLVDDGMVTPFAQSQIGQQIRVRPTRPANALEPGQFYSIQVSDGTGGSVYRESIANCAPDGVFCGQCYDVEPGNMVGPTHQGVDDLIGDPPDTFDATNFCYDPGCRDTSRSLVVAPIWDVCNSPDPGGCPSTGFCPGAVLSESGANVSLRVAGFALVFVEGFQGNDVVARLINVTTCSAGGGGGGGGPTGDDGNPQIGPFSIPVRLVQTPTS
ncbi:MAG TPA: pilus assembly protein TadG-related protein [Acidobacteriota bacterium]|nr:pilus assembly protein TadG-related protein [Acidobacteriota bacterium]